MDSSNFNSILLSLLLGLLGVFGWAAKVFLDRLLGKMDEMQCQMTATNQCMVKLTTVVEGRDGQEQEINALSERTRKLEIWQAEQRGRESA